MALKVKAKERLQKIGKYAGIYRYVMMLELYTALTQEKVIREAALRSGISQGVVMQAWGKAFCLRVTLTMGEQLRKLPASRYPN